ncbi:winged helix-turn-helix domain-containing protein [Klebsiella pneumoniae]|uniref:winged helix-turn-helix domain-containing protein n=1 Tax=Klebsiella pneumoniae TaxID=573 RepID=UPI003364FE6B
MYPGDEERDPNVIEVLVGRLRRKLHDDPAEPQLIITIHGTGYLFTASVAA